MNEKLFLDNFEHIGVYVVDKNSLVVYYENSLAEKYTGKCRIGETCYKVHGNDGMCSSCPIRNKNHVSYVNRPDYNLVFAVRCEEIMWDGHEAYLISVVKQEDFSGLSEGEKSMRRMSRALKKSVNVYTEINMETMEYKQINLRDAEGYGVNSEGEYGPAYEYMCTKEIHPEDVAQVRRVMSPEMLRSISYESNGVQEVTARYRLKNVVPERIMESRAIFLRDEVPHYVVSIAKDVTEEYRIRKQANELESILSNVSCGVAIYNLDESGNLSTEYVNEGLARLAECSKEILMQQVVEDSMYAINEEWRKDFLNSIKKVAAGEKRVDCTIYVTTYKGNNKWLNVNLTASRKESGLLQIFGSFFDVSAEMKVQKEFQDKYEVEKRRSHDDVTILACGVFDLQNNRPIEMERRAPLNEIIEPMSLDELRADICETIVSKERKKEFEKIFNTENLLKKHECGIDEQSMEYQRRLPDGKVIWVRSSFHVISDLSKDTILLFHYCNDINTNKSLEMMTAYMVDADYDLIGCVNLVDDSSIMFYGQNRIDRAKDRNALKMLEKYTKSSKWFEENLVVPEERQFFHENASVSHIRQELADKSSFEFILHTCDKDKNICTKKVRFSRNIGDFDSCFFSQIDITDTLAKEEEKQRRLQEALDSAKQANEAKTAFLSRMSHDMRTPMNGVLGLAALMKDETKLENIVKDLNQLEMSGKYLLQLINDTLDVSKIESGKMELRIEPIDSELVYGNILANANLLAKEKGVEITVERPEIKPEERVAVMADASRLEQVIMNVVSNAIKFTPEGGKVQVVLKNLCHTEHEVVDQYVITDTGIGMSEEFLKHVYEPFVQEGRTNTNRENGTGLGMSIVKQLLELMNGDISIKSEVGKGTEVTLIIRYPVCESQPVKQGEKQTDLDILKNKRILLCEDHPLNAQIAQRLLQKAGAVVEHVENGKLAVEAFSISQQNYYDLILMDIRMPEMNGIEATKAIRALNRTDAKEIHIIAMTANAFDDDVKECAEAGMNAHISKPIEPTYMYETIVKNL